MSYQKQNFRDGEVLSAEQLNRMEEGIAKLETNMITAEDPADSADVQFSVESILKSIEDKGNNILAQIQQNGGKGLTVYCWGRQPDSRHRRQRQRLASYQLPAGACRALQCRQPRHSV